MTDSPSDPELRLPWVQRPRLLVAFVLICLGLVTVSFAAGRYVRSSSDLPGATTAAVGPVYAQVEERVVEKLPGRTGTVTGRDLVSVPTPRASDTAVERNVVTRVPIKTGDTVRAGQLLSVVSGRPVFLLRLPVPLYRPLGDGDTGDDVREVQQALADLGLYHSGVDGSFGPATQTAVAQLYDRAGFAALRRVSENDTDPGGDTSGASVTSDGEQTTEPISKVWLPLGEVFGIDQSSAVVADVTPSGTILADDGASVARLRVGGLVVRARISVDEREAYAVGTKIRISAPELTATSWEGTVTAVSGFRQPSDDSTGDGPSTDNSSADGADGMRSTNSGSAAPGADLPGYDITVRVSGAPEELTADRQVIVIPRKASAEPQLAVPLTAIRQDAEGTFVITEDGQRVTVEVISDADGWAALADGSLSTGTRVQVSP